MLFLGRVFCCSHCAPQVANRDYDFYLFNLMKKSTKIGGELAGKFAVRVALGVRSCVGVVILVTKAIRYTGDE